MPTNIASRPIVYLAIELSATSWVVACRQPTLAGALLPLAHRSEIVNGAQLV
jgi:hypothetical protein